jgi:hypothetical protein
MIEFFAYQIGMAVGIVILAFGLLGMSMMLQALWQGIMRRMTTPTWVREFADSVFVLAGLALLGLVGWGLLASFFYFIRSLQ